MDIAREKSSDLRIARYNARSWFWRHSQTVRLR